MSISENNVFRFHSTAFKNTTPFIVSSHYTKAVFTIFPFVKSTPLIKQIKLKYKMTWNIFHGVLWLRKFDQYTTVTGLPLIHKIFIYSRQKAIRLAALPSRQFITESSIYRLETTVLVTYSHTTVQQHAATWGTATQRSRREDFVSVPIRTAHMETARPVVRLALAIPPSFVGEIRRTRCTTPVDI